MSENEALADDTPSPWWPCPECGGVHFVTVCCFERGRWRADEDVYDFDDPPNGRPSGVIVSNVKCVECGHVFDISRQYEWPIVGNFEGSE